jgi:hypothetical protein
MILDRIPEDRLDLQLSFAQVSPAIAPDEEIARSKGLQTVEAHHNPALLRSRVDRFIELYELGL